MAHRNCVEIEQLSKFYISVFPDGSLKLSTNPFYTLSKKDDSPKLSQKQ